MQPDPNVTAYPAFRSDAPLFGRIYLPRQLHQELQGRWHRFAIDESKGTGRGYDLLYFDLNTNGNLTDDAPVGIWDEPPAGADFGMGPYPERTVFECLDVNLPFGTDGVRPLELMPRLGTTEEGNHHLVLVTPRAFRGKVTIAGRDYEVWLGHTRLISGWFDQPSTGIYLVHEGADYGWYERTETRSMAWRRFSGVDYRLSGTPSGDRLIVSPYQGAYGTLRARPGMAVSGDLYSGEAIILFGGKRDASGRAKPVHSNKAPVGDYHGGFEVYLDDMHFSTGGGAHSDERFRDYAGGSSEKGIRLRQHEPFVATFDAPEVWFAGPALNSRIAVGDELRVQPSLIDAALDMFFTDIEREQRVSTPPETRPLVIAAVSTAALGTVACAFLIAGFCWRSKRRGLLTMTGLFALLAFVPQAVLHARSFDHTYQELPPTVTIARANGQIVSTGKLPFG